MNTCRAKESVAELLPCFNDLAVEVTPSAAESIASLMRSSMGFSEDLSSFVDDDHSLGHGIARCGTIRSSREKNGGSYDHEERAPLWRSRSVIVAEITFQTVCCHFNSPSFSTHLDASMYRTSCLVVLPANRVIELVYATWNTIC